MNITKGRDHKFRRASIYRAVFVGMLSLMCVSTGLFTSLSSGASHGLVPRENGSRRLQPGSSPDGNAILAKVVSPLLRSFPFVPALLQAPANETVQTFASDCLTPKNSFNLGEVVCVQVTDAPLGFDGISLRRLNWVSRAGLVAQTDGISISSQTFSFTLPATESTTFISTVYDEAGNPSQVTTTVDNRGTWKVTTNSVSEGDVRALVSFTVHSPTPYVDLSVSQTTSLQGSGVSAGSTGVFNILVTNSGPDSAQNVQLTETLPANTTFVSFAETSSNLFTCDAPTGGVVNCSAGALPKDASVSFAFVYEVNANTPANTLISNNVSISNATAELDDANNTSTGFASVPGTTGTETCTLDCRQNMTVTANATQGGVSGAFVTFTPTDVIAGNCGSITAGPASTSFFPVGATVVAVTSETGGGACSFTITVVDTAPPTISCPANLTETAPANSSEVTIDVGTPTTTSSSTGAVTSARSDNLTLADPYPIGLTQIIWTVTDSVNRTASCTQMINVNENACGEDDIDPTITAPPDVTVSTGPDNTGCAVALDSELGQPTAADNCSVNVSVSGIPAGNAFPKGTTTLTYTAMDGAGNTATATQLVTVIDDTLPIIVAPGDASYVCPSEVPAGSPSQAHGTDVNLPDGGPPTDNCGMPMVTVSDVNNGGDGSTASPLIITRTFTATDAAGNIASASQTITVIDDTAPTVTAPANATYQCASEVPAADGSQATASDNCAAPTVTASDTNNGGAGSSASPLVITRTFTATDAAGNSSSAAQTITVVDDTAPSVTAPAPTVASADASCQAGIPDVVSGTTASDNCSAGSGITITQSPAAGTLVGLGTHPITIIATDAAGNSSTSSTSLTVNDTTAPTLTCPTNIVVSLPADSSATSMAVNFPVLPTATDNCSVPTVTTSVASGSIFPVGTTTVTATATDDAGNPSTCTFTVTVLYNFEGFFLPVGNLPTLNTVTAGRAVPVKFSLSGDKGLNIFAGGYPVSGAIPCNSSDPVVEVSETLTAGGSSLSFGGDQYNYVWKTESSWVGTCRQLVLKLNDGSEHRANFKFR